MGSAISLFAAATAAMVTVSLTGLLLCFWRLADRRHDTKEWNRLIGTALHLLSQQETEDKDRIFDVHMVDHLPAPAKRFFTYSIAPGTPLRTVSQITMEGKFSLGGIQEYAKMYATQIIAAPYGFIWKMHTNTFTGSDGVAVDGHSWTRFWLFQLIPVARIFGPANHDDDDDNDHFKASFGRYAAEAIVWSPAAVLPQPGVVDWEPIDNDRARMIMKRGNRSQSVDITVDQDGKLKEVVFLRWSNANKEKTFRSQPFGCVTSGFQNFNGYRLSTYVEAGNHYGTNDYFPFFIAEVKDITFPVQGKRVSHAFNSELTSLT